MSSTMSVCKLCSGDLVSARSERKFSGSSRIVSPCVIVQVSGECTRATSGRRQVYSMSAAAHCGSSLSVVRAVLNGVDVFYGRPNSRAGEKRFDFGCTISLTSLSRIGSLFPRKNGCTRRDFKAETRLSKQSSPARAERRLSEKFREIASDATEKATSSSVMSIPSRSEGGVPVNLAAGAGITAAVFMMALLGFVAKPRAPGGGSVSDLIKRGQLRSDRGTGGATLNYDDPFDNPLVRKGKKNPVVRMCGKLFRLAPITLTEEKVTKHQKRRIQAYKWKRPVVFLTEGEAVPKGVDPDEVRWIPENHPFATTSNFIDEDSAQQNIYQTRGVPSRVRAEHEALRKKILETAQKEPEFKLPNMEDSGAEAWKAVDETSEGKVRFPDDEISDSAVSAGNQLNGSNGSDTRIKNGGLQGGARTGASDSRYRTIDFSGEEQGSSRN